MVVRLTSQAVANRVASNLPPLRANINSTNRRKDQRRPIWNNS